MNEDNEQHGSLIAHRLCGCGDVLWLMIGYQAANVNACSILN